MLLLSAIPALVLGLVVSFNDAWFAVDWTMVLPIGVILLGLSILSWMMQNETAKFDADERSRMENARRYHPAKKESAHESVEHSSDLPGTTARHAA